jgi:hypothetical protein
MQQILSFEMITISFALCPLYSLPLVSDIALKETVYEVYDDGEEGEPEDDPYEVPEEGDDHHRQDQEYDVLVAASDPAGSAQHST